MIRVQLSTSELCQITGCHPQAIERWVQTGALVPNAGGGKQGFHRQWGYEHVVAVAYAKLWQKEGLKDIAHIVAYVAGLGPRVLLQIAKDRRGQFLLPVPNDPHLIPLDVLLEAETTTDHMAGQYRRLDLSRCADDVAAAIELMRGAADVMEDGGDVEVDEDLGDEEGEQEQLETDEGWQPVPQAQQPRRGRVR